MPRFLSDIKITCTIRVLSLLPRPTLKKITEWNGCFSSGCCVFFSVSDLASSAHYKYLMFVVRKMVLICSKHNILFKAKHVQGIHNHLADSFSRLQIQTFLHMAPASMLNPACNHRPFLHTRDRSSFINSFLTLCPVLVQIFPFHLLL